MKEKLSQFAHVIDIDEQTSALFNSLWLRVIFFDNSMTPFVEGMKQGLGVRQSLKKLPASLHEQAQELLVSMKQQMFLDRQADEQKLADIHHLIENLSVGILYLILTQNCNMACTYCYLSKALNRKIGDMSMGVAKQAIDLFAKTVEGYDDPQIVFYGGETLLNTDTLQFCLEYASKLIPRCRMSINTNGMLATPEIAEMLKGYGVQVGISIDGPKEIHDQCRVDRGGSGTFDRVIEGLKLFQNHGVELSVSCTITPENVDHLEDVTRWLISELGIGSMGFNLMLGEFPTPQASQKYAQKAATVLVNCFEITKKAGVYEDRMMRRVNALADGVLALNDCGGCGQQFVVTPTGQIGVCQAFMNTGENFLNMTETENPSQNSLWKTWRRRSPFNISECLNCEALGMCGGGCSYNSLLRNGDIMSPDQVHCAHAKTALRYLLAELWQQAKP